jgi:hypothetical protein
VRFKCEAAKHLLLLLCWTAFEEPRSFLCLFFFNHQYLALAFDSNSGVRPWAAIVPPCPLTDPVYSICLFPSHSPDLKKNVALLERAVQTTQQRLVGRVLRNNTAFRRSLAPAALAEGLTHFLPADEPLRDHGVRVLSEVREEVVGSRTASLAR